MGSTSSQHLISVPIFIQTMIQTDIALEQGHSVYFIYGIDPRLDSQYLDPTINALLMYIEQKLLLNRFFIRVLPTVS